MEETSTKTFNEIANMMDFKETSPAEGLGADDLIFYHSLHTELDTLKKKPSLKTISQILDYSKSTR